VETSGVARSFSCDEITVASSDFTTSSPTVMQEDGLLPNGTGPGEGSGSNHGSRMIVLSTGILENPSKGDVESIES
jgi:hypothetical protein